MHLVISEFMALVRPPKRPFVRQAARTRNGHGLEIGGPSPLFTSRGYLPVYSYCKSVDGLNFSNQTIWEGTLQQGKTFRAQQHTGMQYIGEGGQLDGLPGHYDFMLSCHSLEHMANPLHAIQVWNAHLRPGGLLYLVLPDPEHTFDKGRSVSTMEHLITDLKNGTAEDDNTHFDEIWAHFQEHDLIARFPQENPEAYLRDNVRHRAAHHHVFSLSLMQSMLEYCGYKVNFLRKAPPFHLIAVAEKISTG